MDGLRTTTHDHGEWCMAFVNTQEMAVTINISLPHSTQSGIKNDYFPICVCPTHVVKCIWSCIQ